MNDQLPHILLIMSDQHSTRFFGAQGDLPVRTPAMDRLAEGGVLFENCYCPSPLCVPSRASFMTGRHCHHAGVWTNGCHLRSDVPTFAHGLGLAGYRTVLVGRMHFMGEDQRHGFLERRVGDVSSCFRGRNRAEHRFRGYYGCHESLAAPGPGDTFDLAYDQAVAAEACRVIRDHEVSGDARPLAVVLGFYSPHDPYRCPEPYFRAYENTIVLPPDHRPEVERLHPLAQRQARPFADLDDATIRRARAAYAGKVQFVDDLVRGVLGAFEESPLSDNAVCIYTSDHGEMAGEHGLWTKGTFYDAAAKVPLVVSAPGRWPQGRRIAEPVSLLDVGPTLLDLAGAPPLPDADGVSLLPCVRGGGGKTPRAVFSESANPCRRMVRRGRWKLNVYHQMPPELLDLDEDPGETRNLASDPEHASIVAELTDVAHADGWDPTAVGQCLDAGKADRAYLTEWGKTTAVVDPGQWGLPAPF